MSATRCHCCGGMPDTHDTSPRYCYVCRDDCKLVARATILRGPRCPFRLKHGGTTVWPEDRPGLAERPQPRPTTNAPARVGATISDSFEWRGRMRRNVPGG